MPLQPEPENQYEVSFCVHDEETNICTRHGCEREHTTETAAYTLMSLSPTGDGPNLEAMTEAYSLANDAMPNENAASLRNYTVSGSLSNPTTSSGSQANAQPFYTTVTTRSSNAAESGPNNQSTTDLYRFAGDVTQPSRSSRFSPQTAIPEVPPRTKESERSASFYSVIQDKKLKNWHLVVIIIVGLIAIVALSLGVASVLQISEIQNELDLLQSEIGKTLATPTESTKDVSIDDCFFDDKNNCHKDGGVCVETMSGFGCFCKDGWSGNGQNCTEITYKTCASMHKIVGFNTGYYSISPDPGNVEPLVVRCVMDRVKGVTEIGHDSENTILVNGCELPGCYGRNITYEATMDQIVAVIQASTYCTQYIKYECYHAALAVRGEAFGWWVSRTGTKETHWVDGADENSCACSLVANSTCPGCNCNANDSKHRMDEGYLSNKTLLPILQLRFGEVSEVWEEGKHTLGKLRCYD